MFDRETIQNRTYQHMQSFWYVYSLIGILLFTVWTRAQGRENIETDGDWLFTSSDGFYWLRSAEYTGDNFPNILSFDPMTGFPEGLSGTAFGSLYEQLVIIVGYIISFGSPSSETVQLVLAYSPVVASVGIVYMTYCITRQVTSSRVSSLLSAGVLSLVPGQFYVYGTVGFVGNELVSVFFILVTLYYILRAVEEAGQSIIVYEVLRDAEIRSWAFTVLKASLAAALAYLTWSVSIVFLLLLVVSVLPYCLIAYRTATLRPTLLTVLVINTIVFLTVLASVPDVGSYAVHDPSLTHVIVMMSSVLLSFVYWIATLMAESRNIAFNRYVAAILTPTILFAIVASISSTISEAFTSLASVASVEYTTILEIILLEYGFVYVVGAAGVILMAVQTVLSRGQNNNLYVTLVFSVIAVALAYTTPSLSYVAAPFIAIASGVAISGLIQYIELPPSVKQIRGYHALTVFIVAVLIAPVLIIPVEAQTVYNSSAEDQIDDTVAQWEEPLLWMADNTEDTGIQDQEPYSESDFTYPDDAYGVLSWSNAGYWIPTLGDRPSVTNPTGQQQEHVAEFLLAQDEEEANDVLESMGDIRYFAIDSETASPLTGLPEVESAHPVYNEEDLYTPYFRSEPGEGLLLQFAQKEQEYYNSMLGRMFVGNTGAIEASTNTIEYTTSQGQRVVQPAISPVTQHETVEDAISTVESEPEVSHGGMKNPPERVDALEGYRLVKSSPSQQISVQEELFQIQGISEISDFELDDLTNDIPSSVKIFERVDGATVELDGLSDDASYKVEVDVTDPTAGGVFAEEDEEFTYVQHVEDSELTLPYATTGYDEVLYPPEVRGDSSYRVISTEHDEPVAEFDVDETDVINDTDPISVDIEN